MQYVVFFHLAYVFRVYPRCSLYGSFFSLLSSIPLYGYRPHLIYPFIVDGLLGYFCCLAVMNNASVSIRVHALVCIYVFISLEYLPRSGTARLHVKSTCLTFEDLPDCCPQRPHHFTCTTVCDGSRFYILTTLVIVCL